PVFVGNLNPTDIDSIKVIIPISKKEIEIKNEDFVKIIKTFKDKQYVSESELTNVFNKEQIAYLLSNELLKTNEFSKEVTEGIQQWIDYGWHEALIFHILSSKVEYEDDEMQHETAISMQNELINKYYDSLKHTYMPTEYIDEIRLSTECKKLSHVSFEEALLNRRSNRPWKKEDMTINELAEILYVSYYKIRNKRNENRHILNNKDEKDYHKLYKMSYVDAFYAYVIIYDIKGLENGIYFYDISNHKLLLLKKGTFRKEISEICIGQGKAGGGKASIALTIDWVHYMIRYQHERAYRNLFIAAGHIMQNLLITFSGMNKSMFITPAIREEKADELIGLNNYEQAIVYFT